MGAFTGACAVAMGVGYLQPRLGDRAALVGGLAGFAGGLWLTLRRDGQWGGRRDQKPAGVTYGVVRSFLFMTLSPLCRAGSPTFGPD